MNRITGIAIALSVTWFVASCSRRPTNAPTASVGKHVGNSKVDRDKMSDAERIESLERMGRVPAGADFKDLTLAQKTTWWGKPLDPKEFWKGRVLWCDRSAMAAAAAHGRVWPPVPYEDPSLPAYPDDDGMHGKGFGVEGTGVNSASSSKESAFWTKFIKEHPKPPESLERQQVEVAERTLRLRTEAGASNPGFRLPPNEIDQLCETLKQNEIKAGYPSEALSDEALSWAYILSQRKQYEQMVAEGKPPSSPQVQSLLGRFLLDTNYITGPLGDEQLKAANGWKTSYLQRLRKEKADESYISAYLQAWNLSEAAVFGGTNGP